MPLTRSSNVNTKRGKQFMRAIEESRARYEGLPERVQRSMRGVLDSAAQELDIAYKNMSHDDRLALAYKPFWTSPAISLKKSAQ